jgi:hypothetical protein
MNKLPRLHSSIRRGANQQDTQRGNVRWVASTWIFQIFQRQSCLQRYLWGAPVAGEWNSSIERWDERAVSRCESAFQLNEPDKQAQRIYWKWWHLDWNRISEKYSCTLEYFDCCTKLIFHSLSNIWTFYAYWDVVGFKLILRANSSCWVNIYSMGY